MAYQYPAATDGLPDFSVLAVLADPTRRALLAHLRGRVLPVGELARHLPITRPAVSQHLKILKQAHLVTEHRQGTRHYFALNPAGFAGLRDYADSMWQQALSAFAAYVAAQTIATKKPKAALPQATRKIQANTIQPRKIQPAKTQPRKTQPRKTQARKIQPAKRKDRQP